MGAQTASSWYVISLRPRGGHAPMRRAAARLGAGVIALSPWALVPRVDANARRELHAALQAPYVVFTSPAAVRAAVRLCAHEDRALLGDAGAAHWFGVGAGTATALRRAGAAGAQSPARMDSEGVLALPVLQAIDGEDVGLVTAPGGRDAIAPALRARGARVLRADVYDRVPLPPSPRALAALRAAPGTGVIAASSAGALDQVLACVPAELATHLRGLSLAVASERMAGHAKALGFTRIGVARGPQPEALVAAAHALASGSMG
jgi:uroporphyrinogen-III synthase